MNMNPYMLRAMGSEMTKEAVSKAWMRKMLTSSSAMGKLPEDTIVKAVKGKGKTLLGKQRQSSGEILKSLKKGRVAASKGVFTYGQANPASVTVRNAATVLPKNPITRAAHKAENAVLGVPSTKYPHRMFHGSDAMRAGQKARASRVVPRRASTSPQLSHTAFNTNPFQVAIPVG